MKPVFTCSWNFRFLHQNVRCHHPNHPTPKTKLGLAGVGSGGCYPPFGCRSEVAQKWINKSKLGMCQKPPKPLTLTSKSPVFMYVHPSQICFLIGVDISVDPSPKRIIRIPEFKAPHINFLFIDISSPLKYA
jgi:hypothetical protein